MLRAHKLGVLVPLVYHTDVESGRAVLEAVPGRPLQALMEAAVAEAEAGSAGAEAAEAGGSGKAAADLDAAAVALGKALARLHDGDQVHGGLGGSSVLLRDSDGAVVLTDFRRSTNSLIAIDKASDLAALEKALLEAAAGRGGQEAAASTSAAAAGAESGGDGAKAAAAAPSKATEIASAFFEKVLNTYRPSSRMWSAVHNKLAEVRGRKAVSQPGQAAAAAGSGAKAAAANKKAKTEAAK
ncbi:hypothetical protein CHLRE_06g306800v5 [Chlamydomonas reinhardtii]|uniref:non-specific serine/threonine protein kinase n=1 Tax=Chlamydomonas reinhardtii TaxID=3055 RepID=A0A2K3DRH0_CHLRE|nr:uncharacterized protein CHLRE_06g306800v5 [Chlamydomonas reinhardtii]PNW83107.1 hypothetical protein CHLRE_06g306800v5 [Chlamydomonas reinhardtii]